MKSPSWKSRFAAATVLFTAALGAAQLPAHAVVLPVASPAAGSAALLLNGTGVRRDAQSGLYTAYLYLEHKTANPAEVLQTSGAKQFRMVMLHDVKAAQLADLLATGLVANASDDDLAALVSEIFDLGLLLNQQGNFSAGDSVQIDSQPATGTTLTLHSRAQGAPVAQTFANHRLFKVLMGIWLGEHPADAGLKSALLGQTL